MKIYALTPSALSLLLCLSLAIQLQAADKVFPKNGIPASGKIVELTPSKVVIEVRGKNQNFALQDVAKITFDGEPLELTRARDSILNEQYDLALDGLKKIDTSSIESQAVKQEVEFYRWYCEGKLGLAGQGDKKAAAGGLLGLASRNRNTHHLFALSEMLGELAVATGQADQAPKYFKMLLNAPDEIVKARGGYRLGQLELRLGNVDEAKQRFDALAGSDSNTVEMTRLQRMAEVGLAECENMAGDSQSALKQLQGMMKKYDSTDRELFAKIANAQGACQAKLGDNKAALRSYLMTDLIFFVDPEAHAEALYHMKKLWVDAYSNPAKAADAGKRLETLYAASSWATKD